MIPKLITLMLSAELSLCGLTLHSQALRRNLSARAGRQRCGLALVKCLLV